MTRRNCRILLRLGAVVAVLLLALPALADEIEPGSYVEEEAVEPESEPVVEAEAEEEGAVEVAKQHALGFNELFDLMILRPFGLVTTIVGGVFFLPAPLIASPSGAEGVQAAWDHFVAPSLESTFKRPLGEP